MLALVTAIQAFVLVHDHPARPQRGAPQGQRGQATAEYALVLLAAATVALILLAWATKTGKIGELFDKVIDTVIGKVT